MSGTPSRILCGTLLILSLTAAAQAAAQSHSTQPAATRPSHPVSAQTTERATWWLNAAAEQAARIPESDFPAYYVYTVLKMQLCCNPASDAEATLKAADTFRDNPSRDWLGNWYADCAACSFRNGQLQAYHRFLTLAENEADACKSESDAYGIRDDLIMKVAKLSGIPAAIQVVEKVKSPCWQSKYYSDMVNELADQPDVRPTARQCDDLLRRAEESLRKAIDPDEIDDAREKLARALIDAGELDKARQQIELLKDPIKQGWAAGKLAAVYLKRHDAKNFQSAMALLREAAARDSEVKPVIYAKEAERLCDAHANQLWPALFNEAIESAKRIERKNTRSWAFSQIAINQANCGRIDDALKTLKQVGSAKDASTAMESIVWNECTRSQFAAAESQIDRIKDAYVRENTCYFVFRIEAHVRSEPQLRAAFERLSSPGEKVMAADGATVGMAQLDWGVPAFSP